MSALELTVAISLESLFIVPIVDRCHLSRNGNLTLRSYDPLKRDRHIRASLNPLCRRNLDDAAYKFDSPRESQLTVNVDRLGERRRYDVARFAELRVDSRVKRKPPFGFGRNSLSLRTQRRCGTRYYCEERDCGRDSQNELRHIDSSRCR